MNGEDLEGVVETAAAAGETAPGTSTDTTSITTETMKKRVVIQITKVGLMESCKKRQIKIVMPRLEETEHFSEALKKTLDEFKTKREWEGKEWEVEEILDYSWCKLTVTFLFYCLCNIQ